MKPSHILLLFITLFPLLSFGQVNERKPGYILKTNGDTLRGYLKVRNDILNTSGCYFSSEFDGKYKAYTLSDISEYRFDNGKYYVAQKFKLNKKEVHMFVEFLVDGIVDLYYFRTGEKERYLLDKEGEPLIVIEGKVAIKVDLDDNEGYKDLSGYNPKKANQPTKTYSSAAKSKGLLGYIFKEDPYIKEKVENIKFDQRSMIKLTKDYHNKICNDYECIVFSKSTSLPKASLGVYAGATMGKIGVYVDEDAYSKISEEDYSSILKPVFGMNYSSTLPYLNTKLCVDFYLNYAVHYFKYHCVARTYETSTTFSYKQVGVTGMLGYYIVKTNRIAIYPSIGASFSEIFDGANTTDLIYRKEYAPIPVFATAVPEENQFVLSFKMGLHASYKLNEKYFIKPAVIYESIGQFGSVTSSTISFRIGLNRYLK